MTPLPSELATVSVTGWIALAGIAFLTAFGEHISTRLAHKGNQ